MNIHTSETGINPLFDDDDDVGVGVGVDDVGDEMTTMPHGFNPIDDDDMFFRTKKEEEDKTCGGDCAVLQLESNVFWFDVAFSATGFVKLEKHAEIRFAELQLCWKLPFSPFNNNSDCHVFSLLSKTGIQNNSACEIVGPSLYFRDVLVKQQALESLRCDVDKKRTPKPGELHWCMSVVVADILTGGETIIYAYSDVIWFEAAIPQNLERKRPQPHKTIVYESGTQILKQPAALAGAFDVLVLPPFAVGLIHTTIGSTLFFVFRNDISDDELASMTLELHRKTFTAPTRVDKRLVKFQIYLPQQDFDDKRAILLFNGQESEHTFPTCSSCCWCNVEQPKGLAVEQPKGVAVEQPKGVTELQTMEVAKQKKTKKGVAVAELQQSLTAELQKTQLHEGPLGMVNQKNDCFVISVLQALIHCDFFTSLLETPPTGDHAFYAMLCDMIDAPSKQSTPIALTAFMRWLSRTYPESLGNGEMHDAHEFYTALIGRLQTCIKKVGLLFGCTIQNVIGCKACGKTSYSVPQHETSLSLPVPTTNIADRIISLQEMLQTYCAPSTLNGVDSYACQHCKKNTTASKNVTLGVADAGMLVIHLMRFKYDQRVAKKVMSTVSFPSYVTIGAAVFDLYSVVFHIGKNLDSGHFITSAFDDKTQQWFAFNDDSVLPLSNAPKERFQIPSIPRTNPHLIGHPYILVYKRRNYTWTPERSVLMCSSDQRIVWSLVRITYRYTRHFGDYATRTYREMWKRVIGLLFIRQEWFVKKN